MTSIFVRSRGDRRDYVWREVLAQGAATLGETPAPLLALHIESLVWPDDRACVVARFGHRVLVLVTGIESSQRFDFMARPVRDTLLVTGEDEPVLRGLAATAIAAPEAVARVLDAAIAFDEEAGFTATEAPLREFAARVAAPPGRQPDAKRRVERMSAAARSALADELRGAALPRRDGVLVAAAYFASASALHEARVWRGLTTVGEPAASGRRRSLRLPFLYRKDFAS
jgi:hypothetical protein